MKNHDVCRGGLGHLYVAAAEWQHCPLRHGAMAGFKKTWAMGKIVVTYPLVL